jgi:hypothetical protein
MNDSLKCIECTGACRTPEPSRSLQRGCAVRSCSGPGRIPALAQSQPAGPGRGAPIPASRGPGRGGVILALCGLLEAADRCPMGMKSLF